jgi:hypothetical protein
MPFFLVTQTSLVEAQDERKAAQSSIDRLRSGGQVTVAVKSDKTTVTHVVVAAVLEEPLVVSLSENVGSLPVAAVMPQAASEAPDKSSLTFKRMMAHAMAFFVRRT